MGLVYFATSVSCVPTFLVTWRIARRFGGPGLAVLLVAAAVLGPPRELAVPAKYPEWITYGSRVAPVLAINATYVAGFAVEHGVMRLVAGPARGSRLARRHVGHALRIPLEARPITATHLLPLPYNDTQVMPFRQPPA